MQALKKISEILKLTGCSVSSSTLLVLQAQLHQYIGATMSYIQIVFWCNCASSTNILVQTNGQN
jgi:hypothetical protein